MTLKSEPAQDTPAPRRVSGRLKRVPPSNSAASLETVASPASNDGLAAAVAAAGAEAAAVPVSYGWRYTFSSLRNRNYLFLWLGMLAMMAGIQMQSLALGYLVYDLTGSASLLGLVNAGMALPLLSLSLFGGAIADRVDRKRVIQAGQAAAALLALLVGLTISAGAIAWYHLLVAAIVQGALFAVMMPARQAIIPQLVGKGQITNALALNSAGMSATTLAAPVLAGGLYAWRGPEEVYFVVAALACAAVLLTGMVSNAGSGKLKIQAPMMQDIAAGLRYIKHSPIVLVLLLMALATTLLAMPFRSLMPVFVVDVYHRGPDSMGLLLTVMGAGALVGSLFIAAIGRWRRGLLLILGSFASGVALLLLAIFPVYLVAVLIMLLLGLGDAGRRTVNQTLIMEEVEDQYHGRVMSVFMMNFGLMPLGVLPAGIVSDLLGGRAAVAMLAILLLAFTMVVLVTQRRLREMP